METCTTFDCRKVNFCSKSLSNILNNKLGTWNSITAKKTPPTLDKYLHHRIILLARKIKNAQGQAGACHGNMGNQISKKEYKIRSYSKKSTTCYIL